MLARSAPPTRYFSAHEPDVCLARLRQATGRVDPVAVAEGLAAEAGWRPQLKEPKGGSGSVRLRPPRKLGGVLTLTTVAVAMRRDDAGGTIFELTRRHPRWPYLVAVAPFLLAVLLVILAVADAQWGVLVVAAVALAVAVALPRLLRSVGDPDAVRLERWLADVTDAVPWEEDPDT
jgi:hypothetical protein